VSCPWTAPAFPLLLRDEGFDDAAELPFELPDEDFFLDEELVLAWAIQSSCSLDVPCVSPPAYPGPMLQNTAGALTSPPRRRCETGPVEG